MMKNVVLLLITMGLFAACKYDVEEELYPSVDCDVSDMSFVNDILPIISTACYNCHDAASNFGGITIEGYDALKPFADGGSLVGVIAHESGFSPMPQSAPKLLDCEIEKVQAWIAQGALDN